MSATITWTIQSMQSSTRVINGFSEVVGNCTWLCTAVDNGTSCVLSGQTVFTPPQEGDPYFTPYSQLTQDQVLGWTWSSGVDKDQVEASALERLNKETVPPLQQLPVPWPVSFPDQVS